MTERLSFCLYTSRALVSVRSVEAARIYLDARRNNPAHGITGYLHQEDGYFAQYLEGSDAALRRMMRTIKSDWRHRDVAVRVDGKVAQRLFPGWDMAFTDEEVHSFRAAARSRGRDMGIADAKDDQIMQFFRDTAKIIGQLDGHSASKTRPMNDRDVPSSPSQRDAGRASGTADC